MPEKKKLPVGIDNFEKIIKNNFYYVDKTEMIHSLIQNWSEVNLITRPRRFGKTLNMNMLQTFFEIGTDPTVFDGLKISEDREFCEKYMGQFPVIEYSRAMKSHFRKFGNQMSGSGNHLCNYASLLA